MKHSHRRRAAPALPALVATVGGLALAAPASALGPARQAGHTLVTADGRLLRMAYPLFCGDQDDRLHITDSLGLTMVGEGGTKLEHLDGMMDKLAGATQAGLYFLSWFWGDGGNVETFKQWYRNLIPKLQAGGYKNVILTINGDHSFYLTTPDDQKALYQLIRSLDPDIWVVGHYVLDIPGATHVAYFNRGVSLKDTGAITAKGPLMFEDEDNMLANGVEAAGYAWQEWVPGQNCLEWPQVRATFLDYFRQSAGGKFGLDFSKRWAPRLDAKTAALGSGPVTFAAHASRPDGDPLRYAWDFGDGKSDSGYSPTISHGYGKAGTFKAVVTVKGDDLSPVVRDTVEAVVGSVSLAPRAQARAIPAAAWVGPDGRQAAGNSRAPRFRARE